MSWSLTLKCRICGSTVSDESVGCRRAHISALRFITEAGRVAETISSAAGGMYHTRDDTSSLLSFLYPQRTPQLIARIAAFLDGKHSCRPSSTLSLSDVLIWQILHKQNVKCYVCCLWLYIIYLLVYRCRFDINITSTSFENDKYVCYTNNSCVWYVHKFYYSKRKDERELP